MFTTTLSRPAAPHFSGKDKQKVQPESESLLPSQMPETSQSGDSFGMSAEPTSSHLRMSILEKMFSGWGIGVSSQEKKKAKVKSSKKMAGSKASGSEPVEEGAMQSASSSKPSRFHMSAGLRKTVPAGTRMKAATPVKKSPTMPSSSKFLMPNPKIGHLQDVSPRQSLGTIAEDQESVLSHSLPNVAASLSQLLTPPPQLPAPLENLDELSQLRPDTPASSLWVEDTTGLHSRVTTSAAPSRDQEAVADESDGSYDSDSEESMLSDTSSAMLVDDDEEVKAERVERATKKWAKAVKSQQLGSFVAQMVKKPNIHENPRYLEGDSDLDSIDQALFYDSDESSTASESESESYNSAAKPGPANQKSLLTKMVEDPKFDLVTEHQKISRHSNDYMAATVNSQIKIQGERRIQELVDTYTAKQLAKTLGKLNTRHGQIQEKKFEFLHRLRVLAGMSFTEHVAIRQNVLNNLSYEAKLDMEKLALASRKGKLPRDAAKAQQKELQNNMANIQSRQQQLDSAVGVMNQLEANESQIQNRIGVYQAAIPRAISQEIVNKMDRVLHEKPSDQQMVDLSNSLGHEYSGQNLQSVKAQLAQQDTPDKSLRHEILTRALKFQDTMTTNICERTKASSTPLKDPKELASQLKQDFSKVELREALRRLSTRQDSNTTYQRAVIQQALKLHYEASV